MARGRHRQNQSQENYDERPPVASATAMLRLDLLRTYKLSWLPGDMLAGLIVFAVTIPGALAYGQLAGLQPINGLYASLVAMAVYAFFGTSRHLIVDAGGRGGDSGRFLHCHDSCGWKSGPLCDSGNG